MTLGKWIFVSNKVFILFLTFNLKSMAAAIGDLEWLKQSLRFSSEMAFDKNVSMIEFDRCIVFNFCKL